jgi:hypothetical protein
MNQTEKNAALVRLTQLVREAIGIVSDDEIDPVDVRDWLKEARKTLTDEFVDKIQKLAK